MEAIRKHSILFALFVSAAVFTGSAVAEQNIETILLKKQGTITTDQIRLGQVVKNADQLPGGLGQLPLGNAPWAGRVRKVGPELIELRMVAAGYNRIPFKIGGADVCLVRRRTQQISAAKIVEVARKCLLNQLPEASDNVTVEVLNDVHAMQLVDTDASHELRPSCNQNGSLVGRTRIKVGVVQNGKRVEEEPVIFRVRLYRPVAVAKRSIPVSSPVFREAIVWKRRDLGAIRGDCVVKGEKLADKIVNRSVSPGQVITHHMLKEKEQPVCVEPQQLVNLVVDTKNLRVVVRGKALEQGRKGDWVKAINRKTGRKVSGQVIGDGQIRVKM